MWKEDHDVSVTYVVEAGMLSRVEKMTWWSWLCHGMCVSYVL